MGSSYFIVGESTYGFWIFLGGFITTESIDSLETSPSLKAGIAPEPPLICLSFS
jgi:hypothetical protein